MLSVCGNSPRSIALARLCAWLVGHSPSAQAHSLASSRSRLPADNKQLADFVRPPVISHLGSAAQDPLATEHVAANNKLVYIQTYGCQMNTADTEVVLSVLAGDGFARTDSPEAADVVLLNTCAIRDNAEKRVWTRLGQLGKLKEARRRAAKLSGGEAVSGPVVGVLGCMAERLKHALLEQRRLVDIVVGPDAYRDLPRLISSLQASTSDPSGGAAINVQLSLEETYADIAPLRPAGARQAFLSIMRGCNNMCAFCVVPFTRGRERSRPVRSILDEVTELSRSGVREITLLGQNVNSYCDTTSTTSSDDGGTTSLARGASEADNPYAAYAPGFRSVYKPQRQGGVQFAELLDRVADVDPEMRIRFTSPHPKDFSDDVLQVIAERPNVCKQLHMPAQSGSSSVLQRMRRGYGREAYDLLIQSVRRVLPQAALSTDIIAGFCGETEEEHAHTLDLMTQTAYESAFMFAYSQRDKTHAARQLKDDIPSAVKQRRLAEIIAAFRGQLPLRQEPEIGRRHLVLVEGPSRRDPSQLTGRTCSGKRVMIPAEPVADAYSGACHAATLPTGSCGVSLQPGDYAAVHITGAGAQSLAGKALARTRLQEFVACHGSTMPLAAVSLAALERAVGHLDITAGVLQEAAA